MEDITIILFFILGLIFGSFFNVVGLRLPRNQTFTNDHSICPFCQNRLPWMELIPVISFILQTGRCRQCKKKISFIYPAGELITGILFAFSFVKIGFTWELIMALLLVSMLMIILVADIKYMLIPNKILLFFLPPFIILRFFNPLDPWWTSITGAFIPVIIIAIIILVSRGGMGAGDMKLFGVLGVVLGLEKVLLAFVLACIIGAIIGMILLQFKLVDRKQPLPFGPYIILASLISYFYGDPIISLYVTSFF